MNDLEILNELIESFQPQNLIRFFRAKNQRFRTQNESLSEYNDDRFSSFQRIGQIDFENQDRLIVICAQSAATLTERSSKQAQYKKAKDILKSHNADAGVFVYYDDKGQFRFSLVFEQPLGKRRIFNNFKRFTFFVSEEYKRTNRTFRKRIGAGDFGTLEGIKDAFAVAPVVDEFYNEFEKIFKKLTSSVCSNNEHTKTDEIKDFALLFVIRIIFIGFVQNKKWIGEDEKFLQNFWTEYRDKRKEKDEFYQRWLDPLFFEALNKPLGHKVAYQNNDFSKETENKLQMAPYLNGGIFHRKKIDEKELMIPDQAVDLFFEFLFSYNFTIEENRLDDEDLSLNPEFLGIIFERLVNKEYGSVYTPRTEVDLMCRLSLVKWLEKNNSTNIPYRDLYELFFKEGGPAATEEEQRFGSFSKRQYEDVLDLLENVTICDPAVGSGAFPVGMIHVLDEVEQHVRKKLAHKDHELTMYERKKRIIERSLYGAEVKPWAVWITQLRLWITLFIDAPDEMRQSLKPILPSLEFKIACGDSLVQMVGKKVFPIMGHANISVSLKRRVTELRKLKAEYFNNAGPNEWEIKQRELALFREILGEQIKELARKLNAIQSSDKGSQISLDFVPQKEQQMDLNLTEEQKKNIQNEIEELQSQKAAITKENVPFIWPIEFPEIFVDKGGFDIVIGNPPYVRQEDIADPLRRVKNNKDYKSLLQEVIRSDFSDYFKRRKEKIDAKSDLYTYFYLRTFKLLHANGIHTFICSNSWLDVGYGVWMQKFLLERVPVHFIIDNHAKRSFPGADVNTIISVMSSPQARADKEHAIKFVAFKKSFEESIFTENLLDIEEAKHVKKGEQFRVYPIKNEDLFEEGMEYEDESDKKLKSGKYVGEKWGGKYLRAPDIFFTILVKGKDKLIRLGDIAKVRRGFTTGANEFFYLTDEEVRKWKIEEEFLKPVIKSPRECRSILVDPSNLNFRVFMCNKTKKELKGTNALKYIEWGEKVDIEIRQGQGKGSRVKGFHNLATIKGRKLWWSLDGELGNTFWVKETNDRLAVYIADKDILADCRLYYGNFPSEIQLFVNSAVYDLFAESLVRAGLGLGARSLMVFEVNKHLVLSHESVKGLKITHFKKLLSRENKNIFQEFGIDPQSKMLISEQEPNPLPDRAALDNIIFDALDLTEEERKDVYRAVCQLVWNRISKAKSVKKRK